MNNHLDPTDQALLKEMDAERNSMTTPRVGDYVLFASGQLERISHDWDDVMQTSPGGSFNLSKSGRASFSGGLNPPIPVESLQQTQAQLPGEFWFFHHGITGPHRAIYADIQCRVYKTTAPYGGYLGPDFQSKRTESLKTMLMQQMV